MTDFGPMDSMDTGFDFFSLFPVFFIIIFVIVIGTFIFNAAKGVSQWKKNEDSPQLSVYATVKGKRTHVRGTNHGNDHHSHTSTSYYATFEFESGDRKEFHLPASDYAQLADEDRGTLTFKGSRFIGFERY